MKALRFGEGYAREAEGTGKVVCESPEGKSAVGSGRGCWIDNDGRESLHAPMLRHKMAWKKVHVLLTLTLSRTQNEALSLVRSLNFPAGVTFLLLLRLRLCASNKPHSLRQGPRGFSHSKEQLEVRFPELLATTFCLLCSASQPHRLLIVQPYNQKFEKATPISHTLSRLI
jgi:hypothetical protein